MGKTDTIKDRRVDVYLDSLERKERWKEYAEAEAESLSSFVQQAVEYTIEVGGPNFDELGQTSQKIKDLQQRVRELEKQLEQKDIVIEKLEADLREHRTRPFTTDVFEGARRYEVELVDILQEADRLPADRILDRLDVDPTDTEVVQGINEMLRQLEEYGIVRSTPQGWVWDR